MNDNKIIACQNLLELVRFVADQARQDGETMVFDDLCNIIWCLEAELLYERRRRKWMI